MILIVIAAILVGVYVSWRAGRLDRLHARVEAARAALDAALVRRSSVSVELAASGLLDPATSLLIAGRRARRAGRGRARRAGAKAISPAPCGRRSPSRGSVPPWPRGPAGTNCSAELEAAAHQVFLARKFYNDAVAATRAARRRWLVRLLRLAGGAPLPEFFEIDESLVDAGNAGGRGADMPHLTAGDPPSRSAAAQGHTEEASAGPASGARWAGAPGWAGAGRGASRGSAYHGETVRAIE